MPWLSLLFFLLVFGMAIGWVAQLVVNGFDTRINWPQALITGIAGSFVGGIIASLVFDHELELRPSGIIGSLIGAILLVLIVNWVQRRK